MRIEKYSKCYEITYRDVDLEGCLRMGALVDYMQEVSGEHASILGFDYSGAANDKKLFWVVSRAKMHLNRPIKQHEKLTIETYPNGMDGLFAMRQFNLYDEAKEQVGEMIGAYLLLDCQTQHPVRMKRIAGPLEALLWPYEGESLNKLQAEGHPVFTDTRQVRSSEIDMNQHMNNAHYIRWCMDTFTTEELASNPIQTIQTNYVKALREGDRVKVSRYEAGEKGMIIQGTSLEGEVIYWTSLVNTLPFNGDTPCTATHLPSGK